MADTADQELLALLKKEQAIHKTTANTAADSKTAYYRRKRAQDMVQGYKAVLALKTELIAAGLDPELFTAQLAEDTLYEQWSNNATTKASQAI